MSKNLIIDGRTLNGVTTLKAMDSDTMSLVAFSDTSDATATASDINAGKTAYVDGVKLNGTNTGVTENSLDDIVDGSLTAFIMPPGKTTIAPFRCRDFTNLTSLNLGGATSIGDYAFYGCTQITELTMPDTLTNIGGYAFRGVSSASGATPFVFTPPSACVVGTYAFDGAKISKIAGNLPSIGAYAFSNNTNLVEIDIESENIGASAFYGCTAVTAFKAKIDGVINTYAFYGCTAIESASIDPDSNITSIGDYAFSRFASSRSNPSLNPIEFDLRKSTFTSIPQYAFGGDSATANLRNQYMKILFPSTVAGIDSYAFRYTNYCDFYFTSPTPPTLNSTTVWGNAGGYKIFVPFSSVNAYRTATNWTAQSSVMRGFSEAGAFEPGYKLPKYNVEGYELTWYSDSALTVPATMVEDSSAIYYCTAGTQKVAYGIKSITALDCTISITDGDTNYHLGYGVPSGTLLTIAGVPNIEGYVPYLFRVNGADFLSGDQITVDSDISIKAIYWDGITVPTNPTFGENTWDVIFRDFKAGTASRFWSVGDTKPITLTNGAVHTIRIADMQIGRYALSDGSGSSNGVLEFAECLDSVYKMHLTPLNTGGWAASEMKNAHMETIYSLLPADLKSAISEAVVLSNSGYSSYSITSSNNKLFLPSVYEIAGGSYDDREGSPQFDYYRLNNNAARIKYRGTSAAHWVTRSAATNGNSYYRITNIGSVDTVSSNSNISVSPCFAV